VGASTIKNIGKKVCIFVQLPFVTATDGFSAAMVEDLGVTVPRRGKLVVRTWLKLRWGKLFRKCFLTQN